MRYNNLSLSLKYYELLWKITPREHNETDIPEELGGALQNFNILSLGNVSLSFSIHFISPFKKKEIMNK